MKPNAHYTEIAFILDRSGSMKSCQQAAIDGFNRFLADQQQIEGLAKLTLVLFDDEYFVPISSIPVQEIVPLTDDTYQPQGCTALLDAIGKTVDDLGLRLAALAEKDRPGQVIVAILTDGLENASQRFNWKEIEERSNTGPTPTNGCSSFWARTRTPSPLLLTSASQQTTPPITLLMLPAQKQATQLFPARRGRCVEPEWTSLQSPRSSTQKHR